MERCWRRDARARGESWPRKAEPWTRCRYADTNCDLCPIGGGGRCTGDKGTRTAGGRRCVKAFRRGGEPPRFTHRGAVIVGVVVGARCLPTSQTFHLLVHANRLYEAGFCRNRRRDSRPRCDRRLWNADSFLLSPIDAPWMINMPWDTGVRAAAEGLVLKWFFIPSLISNLPPFRLVTDQIFIRLFRLFLSFFLSSRFFFVSSGERRKERFRF